MEMDDSCRNDRHPGVGDVAGRDQHHEEVDGRELGEVKNQRLKEWEILLHERQLGFLLQTKTEDQRKGSMM